VDRAEKVAQPKSIKEANSEKPSNGKVILYGNIYNASNQLKLPSVTISARPINSIFSKEIQSDDDGNFRMEVDSGQIFVLSFFKADFKISKQLVDLSEKSDKLNKIQDIYLSENVDIEISKDMPVLYFEKNKSELSESITEELDALSVLLRGNRGYTIRLIGLAASDETFTKPLSTSRVAQVAQYLVSAKVPQDQIKFTAIGDNKRRSNCGFNRPCTTQDYNNDRVVVYIISQPN
jgi:outer membrane protein OmpA-like peptidoglycan-associated protein